MLKTSFIAKLIPHIFSSSADIYSSGSKMSTNVGTEVDFALGYKLAKKVQLNGGFSKMYGTSFLEVLIGGERTTNNFST